MAFIGNQPTAVPLTSSQLADGLITSAKIADGAIVNVDVNSTAAVAYSKLNLATSIVNGDIANATIALAKLSATGTPSASTFLRGDNSWASAGAAAGQVIQVVSTNKTDTFASSSIANTFVDVTGLSVSITPSSASNKILVLATVNHGVDGIRATALKLLRDSTDINIGTGSMGNRTPASTVGIGENFDANRGEVSSINFLDSPATTSAITYKIQVGILESTANVARINTSGADGDATYIARSASTITVMEIKG